MKFGWLGNNDLQCELLCEIVPCHIAVALREIREQKCLFSFDIIVKKVYRDLYLKLSLCR